MPCRILLLVLALSFCPTRTATAEPSSSPPAALPTAAVLLAEAEGAFVHDADCGRALPLFEAAFRLEPTWIALNGMAMCHEMNGRPDVAHRLYSLLLREHEAELPPARRGRVEARIVQLAGTLGALDLGGLPAGARVRVDGEDVGRLPVSLVVGSH